VVNIQLGYFLGYGSQGGFRHLHAGAEVTSATWEGPMNQVAIDRVESNVLLIRLAGRWELRNGLASAAALETALRREPPPSKVAFDAQELGLWDSSILAFLAGVSDSCRERGVALDATALPTGLHNLLDLAVAVPERAGARKELSTPPFLERLGAHALAVVAGGGETLSFLGSMTLASVRLVRRNARYRASDLWLLIQQCGGEALPIVTLISFLVGVILAFVGAVQLKQFGAQIYVANLVGVAMTREMGALMSAILMAGRTGASFAAELGTMKVTQELDAFTTAGFSIPEFLVLPRVMALVLMMPLLCLYADFVGILGGATIGVGMLDLSWTMYIGQTTHAVRLGDTVGGLFKSAVYGGLIAGAGCVRGLQAGSSASAVGRAATSAVVTSMVAIIVACGVFAFLFYVLGI
jgi:phospholipid/cholesterol/gamma-HCH transport system permease protein